MAWLDELRTALEAESHLTPERVCEVISRDFGGSRLYVPSKRPFEPEPNPRLTPRQIEQQHGVSPSTAHRWACRWRSSR